MLTDTNHSAHAAATDALSQPSPSTLPAAAEQSSLQPIPNNSNIPHSPCGRKQHNNGNNNNGSNNIKNDNKNKRRRRGKQQQQAPPPKALAGCSVCNIIKDNEPPKYKCPKCRASYCSVVCCRQHKTVCPGKEGEEIGKTAAATTTLAQKTTLSNPAAAETKGIYGGESDTDDYSDNDDDDSSLEDGWKITDDMKVALRNSTWLRTELQDGGLRDMISSVVRSEKKFKSYHRRHDKHRNHRNKYGNRNHKKNHQQQPNHPHEELGAKRADNKNFDVFTDKLLVLADVLERQDRSMNCEVGEKQNFAPVGGPPSNRNEEELEEWLKLKWDPGIAPPALALRPKRIVIPKFEPIDISSSEDEDDDDEPMEPKDNADVNS